MSESNKTGTETAEAEAAAVATAFGILRTAASLLGVVPWADHAASLRRQMDRAWYTDPTTMNTPGVKEDMERKLRLMDAAGAFMTTWEEVKEAALAAGLQPPAGDADEREGQEL